MSFSLLTCTSNIHGVSVQLEIPGGDLNPELAWEIKSLPIADDWFLPSKQTFFSLFRSFFSLLRYFKFLFYSYIVILLKGKQVRNMPDKMLSDPTVRDAGETSL